jgi:aldose 1-epimerase
MAGILRLEAGLISLELAPEAGGSIAAFRRRSLPLMREMPGEAVAARDARAAASYPLVPYSNRIAGGRFAFGGEDHALALNFGDHPHSIHGNGWQRAWTVESAAADAATLTLEHDPARDGAGGWPFAYRAEQAFTLDGRGLGLTIAIENRDARPFPAALGLHPFFPVRAGGTLRFSAQRVWLNGPDMLPTAETAVPRHWSFAAARSPRGAGLDNCFSGWSGAAELRWEAEGVGLRMTADPLFGHLVVYTPASGETVAVEPVSAMNDAVNRMAAAPGHGLRVLAPGERLAGTVRFEVEAR